MRVERIDIRGFGCLRDRVFELPSDRAALVIADNEQGKSTFASAIIAGICGFPKRGAKGAYEPWNSDGYGVSMRLEVGGRSLQVERDFARNKFTVRDLATNADVSSECDEDLAATILQLPRDDFIRIALVLGKEVHRFGESVSLKSRLTELVEGSRDADAETAIAAIGNARYLLDNRSLKIETAIGRLTDDRDEARQKMSRLDNELASAEQETRELSELQQRHEDLTAQLDRLNREYRAAGFAEVREQLRSAREQAEAVERLHAELSQLDAYSNFPAERADQLTRAMTRREELESRLRDLQSRISRTQEDADRMQVAVDQEARFASATENDVSGLGGCADAMEDAARKAEEVRADLDALKRGGLAYLWGSVAALGLLGALAFVGSMIMHLLSLAASVVGSVLSGLVAAVGLTFVVRGGRQRSEITARLRQTQEFYDSSARRATRLLSVLGVECEAGGGIESGLIDITRRTQDALSRDLSERKRLADLRSDISSLERDSEDTRRKIGDENAAISGIFSEAGIDCSLPLDDARRRFEDGLATWRRYREIRNVLLPELEKRLMPAEDVAGLEARESELAGDTGADASQRSSADVESERQSARTELDRTTARLRELEGRIGALVENYRRQYPALQEEAARLDRELRKARRFGEALSIAGSTLEQVAETTRRRWASALNDRAAAILPHLNPDYDQLLFDDRLDFTVRRISDQMVVDKTRIDESLSTGAKDQVYLAARLACAAEVSCAEPVPIILDDALIAFDDRRFETALQYLVEEVAGSRQVIMLSCHRSRHERLAGQRWFQDRIELIRL